MHRKISPSTWRNSLLAAYSCGHQGSEMFINFINPMYPAQDIMSGSCNFRVVVSNPSVCQVTQC